MQKKTNSFVPSFHSRSSHFATAKYIERNQQQKIRRPRPQFFLKTSLRSHRAYNNSHGITTKEVGSRESVEKNWFKFSIVFDRRALETQSTITFQVWRLYAESRLIFSTFLFIQHILMYIYGFFFLPFFIRAALLFWWVLFLDNKREHIHFGGGGGFNLLSKVGRSMALFVCHTTISRRTLSI